jgi:hypothetical protein
MFVDKFLLWKTFPICCLRWVLQFAVLECPPDANSLTKGPNNRGLLGTLQHLLAVWSKSDFVQSASMEQQTCILCHSSPSTAKSEQRTCTRVLARSLATCLSSSGDARTSFSATSRALSTCNIKKEQQTI